MNWSFSKLLRKPNGTDFWVDVPQTDSHAQKWIPAWSARDADEMSSPNQSALRELVMNADVTAVASDLRRSPQSQLSFFLTVGVHVSPSPCVGGEEAILMI